MSSIHLTLSNGILIFIEGNKKNGEEWHTAYKWQSDKFIEMMEFGTMKSMGAPNPLTLTEPFTHRGTNYRFRIIDDWGPCYIENMTTHKIREIKYFHLESSSEKFPYSEPKYKAVSIKKTY